MQGVPTRSRRAWIVPWLFVDPAIANLHPISGLTRFTMRNNLHPMTRSSHVLAVFLTFLPALAAQCATQWASGSAVPGVNGPVTAITAWS
jgi:hypothetical protein